MRFGKCSAAIALACTCAIAGEGLAGIVGVVATNRNELTIAGASVGRRDVSGPVNSVSLYSDVQFDQGLQPIVLSASSNGTVFDTATGTVMVATGNGYATLSSSIVTNGPLSVRYEGAGTFGSSVTTGTLAGYFPPNTPPDTTPYVEAVPVYNSGLSILVSGVPANYTMTVGMSNTQGTVFNAGFLFLDFNDDGNFDIADGDVEIEPYFLVAGNGSETRTGMLMPNAAPYRVSFFGNVYDLIEDDNVTVASQADWTTVFEVTSVPEPAGAAVLLAGLLALRRRR